MGLGGVAIVILPSIMCLKLTFSDGLGGVNPELKTELQGNGWRKGKKMLTPLQVRTIVQYLGEP